MELSTFWQEKRPDIVVNPAQSRVHPFSPSFSVPDLLTHIQTAKCYLCLPFLSFPPGIIFYFLLSVRNRIVLTAFGKFIELSFLYRDAGVKMCLSSSLSLVNLPFALIE